MWSFWGPLQTGCEGGGGDSKDEEGATAGIVVVILIFLFAVAAVAVYTIRKKRTKEVAETTASGCEGGEDTSDKDHLRAESEEESTKYVDALSGKGRTSERRVSTLSVQAAQSSRALTLDSGQLDGGIEQAVPRQGKSSQIKTKVKVEQEQADLFDDLDQVDLVFV